MFRSQFNGDTHGKSLALKIYLNIIITNSQFSEIQISGEILRQENVFLIILIAIRNVKMRTKTEKYAVETTRQYGYLSN